MWVVTVRTIIEHVAIMFVHGSIIKEADLFLMCAKLFPPELGRIIILIGTFNFKMDHV